MSTIEMPTVEEIRCLLWPELLARERATAVQVGQLDREVTKHVLTAALMFMIMGAALATSTLPGASPVAVILSVGAAAALVLHVYLGVRISRTTLASARTELQMYANERVWRGY